MFCQHQLSPWRKWPRGSIWRGKRASGHRRHSRAGVSGSQLGKRHWIQGFGRASGCVLYSIVICMGSMRGALFDSGASTLNLLPHSSHGRLVKASLRMSHQLFRLHIEQRQKCTFRGGKICKRHLNFDDVAVVSCEHHSRNYMYSSVLVIFPESFL